MRPGQAKPETHIFNHSPIFRFGEGNGTPLQYSCLENPMDGGAWKAAVHGVTKVRHDLVTSLSLFTFMHWRRQWHPTSVFLPGESQGHGSLVGCLWGRIESDTAEATQKQQQQQVYISAALATFTLLYNSHHYPSPEFVTFLI